MVLELTTELFGNITTLIILSAVVVGIAWRTLGKYWDKIRDGEITKFSPQFVATAISALVAAGVPALALMPVATVAFTESLGQYGLILAWLITAGWAYGANEGINYTWGRLKGKAETDFVASGKLDMIISQKVAARLNEGIEVLQQQREEAVSTGDLPKDTIGGSDSVTQP